MIKFINNDRAFYSREKTAIKQFIEKLIRKEGYEPGDIQYIFCSDDYLLGINRQFLQHDYYTDIITFPISEGSEPIQAELYISIDRVRDNAKQGGVSFKEELHRVIFMDVFTCQDMAINLHSKLRRCVNGKTIICVYTQNNLNDPVPAFLSIGLCCELVLCTRRNCIAG